MGEVVLFLNQTSPLLGLADSTTTKPDFHVWQWRYISCDLLCCEITTTKVRIRGRKGWPATTGLKSIPRGIWLPAGKIQSHRFSVKHTHFSKWLECNCSKSKKAGPCLFYHRFDVSRWSLFPSHDTKHFPTSPPLPPPLPLLFICTYYWVGLWKQACFPLFLSQVMCLFSWSHLLVYGAAGRSLSHALLSPVLSRGILAAEILFTTYRF